MVPEDEGKSQGENSTKSTDRNSQSMPRNGYSRHSLTTIMEERTVDMTSLNMTNMKRHSTDIEMKVVGAQLSGFFIELEERLKEICSRTAQEVVIFLKDDKDNRLYKETADYFMNFLLQSQPKAINEAIVSLSKTEIYLNNMINNTDDHIEVLHSNNYGEFMNKSRDSAHKNAPTSKLDSLRQAFASELEKTQNLRYEKLTAAIENKAVTRDKVLVDEVRQYMKIDQPILDKGTLALLMKQRQDEEAQFLFEQKRTIDDLHVKISKL